MGTKLRLIGSLGKAVLAGCLHINSGPLRLYDLALISYDGDIENRKFQRRITIDRHKESKVQQELYRANQYEKPRQDAGVFYYLNFLN